MAEGAGDRFQRETKYFPFKMPSYEEDIATPDRYKAYPDSPRVRLPIPELDVEASLDYALKRRRSTRVFTSAPLKLNQLSYLLWASTGIQRVEYGREFRTAPSAGALYPIETYLVVNNVEGMQRGVYHYNVGERSLEEIRLGDYAHRICDAALGQEACSLAAIVFIWTAIFDRSKVKYGQRAYRYIYLDAGHIAENLALAAVSLGLGSCPIAALYDDEVNAVIDVDGMSESVVYMTVAGWPRVAGQAMK